MLMAVGFRKKPVENVMSVSSDPAKQSFIFCELGRSWMQSLGEGEGDTGEVSFKRDSKLENKPKTF